LKTKYNQFSNRLTLQLISEQEKTLPVVIFLSPGIRDNLPGQAGAEVGEILQNQDQNGQTKVVVSLGEKDKINSSSFRKAGAAISTWLSRFNEISSRLVLKNVEKLDNPENLAGLFEGLFLGSFQFSKYKTSNVRNGDLKIFLDSDFDSQSILPVLNHAKILTRAVNLNRDWAHEPANVIDPITLTQRVQNLAQELNIKCTILDEVALSRINAGGILAVGQGSKTPPRMIILEYAGDPSSTDAKPVILVGKALTFDSGGYSLKDSNNIQQMKFDKTGGVIVAAVLQAAAELKIKRPVVGIIAAAQNMISENAYLPDDILTTLSGKTVEVISTDAEGRLVLADALTYAQTRFNPESIIDLATLTGGVVVALGRVRAGLLSNNDQLSYQLLESGEATSERLWRLPLDEDYFKQIEGDEADLKNSGGREASTITGGIFLKQFISDAVPWAHIDIAGVADSPKPTPLGPKGATGFGVRLLVNYLENSKSS